MKLNQLAKVAENYLGWQMFYARSASGTGTSSGP